MVHLPVFQLYRGKFNMAKRYILIAEDDAAQRELYTLILEFEGYEVKSVSNGREALEEIQRKAPDLILTDIGMPEIDGLELIQLVKEQKALADIPVVVMTSFQKGYLTWAWAAGAKGAIAKPFSPEDLFTAIREALPERSGH
jgi:CheY-like chemotaxis protein